MRYDILAAITSGIEPSRISFNLEKSSIMRLIREMLPVELEYHVESLLPEQVKFQVPEHYGDLDIYYASEKFHNEEGYDNITFTSQVEDDDVILKSMEMISFKEKANYIYSSLETLIGKETILIDCARTKMVDQAINSADIYTFVFDKKIIDKEEGKRIIKFLKGDLKTTDFLEELFSLKENLKKNFILPDYYEGVSVDISNEESSPAIDIDGEKIKSDLEISFEPLKKDSKKTVKLLKEILTNHSGLLGIPEIEEWEEAGIKHLLFDSKDFMEINLSAIKHKREKAKSYQKV